MIELGIILIAAFVGISVLFFVGLAKLIDKHGGGKWIGSNSQSSGYVPSPPESFPYDPEWVKARKEGRL